MAGVHVYQARLQAGNAVEQLAADLAWEDERQAALQGWLAGQGAAAEDLAHYAGWDAAWGGGQALQDLVARAADSVRRAASRTPAGVGDFYCGLWPDPSFNAWSEQTGAGNVVYVTTGLVRGLRYVTQAAAEALPALQQGEFGASDEHRARLDALLREHLAGTLRHHPVQVLVGHPEQLRRGLVYGGLQYVIAHEAAHLAASRWGGPDGWVPDMQQWQEPQAQANKAALPDEETQAVRAVVGESHADGVAGRLLHEIPAETGQPMPDTLLMGAMCALATQAGLWWRRAALTQESLGWRHPLPDFRLASLTSTLATPYADLAQETPETERPNQLDLLGRAFGSWLRDALALDDYRSAVAEAGGLANRGINPLVLAMLYTADALEPGPHAMPREPSDIVAALAAQDRAEG